MSSVSPPGGGMVTATPAFQRWLDQRVPASVSVTLHQRNIFILPTREGMYFAVLILIMMLAATNYQNSLMYALAFSLVSLFVVSILHTYRNLAGLTLRGGEGKPCFAGQRTLFQIHLDRNRHVPRESIEIGWDREWMVSTDLVDVADVDVRVYSGMTERGLHSPGRLLIETRYPVGLFRAWSWVDLKQSALVYPRPIPAGPIPVSEATDADGELASHNAGSDDFYGFRDAVPGDSPRRISWKHYARTRQLITREYRGAQDHRIWLDWQALSGVETEARLSRLTDWVLQMRKRPDDYGLRLPGITISAGSGPEHHQTV
ncbi:MAG: DUF58 domain-containing protein, partial [Pseudomonadota bacterium]